MLTKLTLSIPKALLLEAKTYSQRTHQPLSQLVSHYFSILSRRPKRRGAAEGITARVRKVTGLAKSSKSDDELLFEAIGSKHLK